jgi:hypothetical protein
MWFRLKFLLRLLRLPAQRRYAWRWLWSQSPRYLLTAPSPWLTFGSIDFLRRWLKPALTIFEYGSGGSTLFWLKFKPKAVVSVEHDSRWYAILSRRLDSTKPIDYRLILPDALPPGQAPPDVADPEAYASTDQAWAGYSFRRYATQIDAFPDRYFDIVLVDGRARPACLWHSADKVRVGGLLILDNADVDYYLAQTAPRLTGYAKLEFHGAGPINLSFWQTNIYVRNDPC